MEDKIKQTMRKVQMVAIAKLHPYENNPRNNEKAVPKIAESIKRYGFNVPITADRNGVIATGHTRYKAALSLGLREVPVIYLDDLDESEIAAWRLVDNKTGEIATWEEDKLNLELKALLGLKVDLSDFGFPGEDKMLEQVREDDFMPVLPKEPRSRRGDIYLLGDHVLMCGDATSEEDMAKLMGGKLADLTVTDPPYNVDYEGSNRTKEGSKAKRRNSSRPSDKILNDNMDEQSFRTFLGDSFEAMRNHLREGGVFYIWHSENHGLSFRLSLEAAGLEVRQCLIWEKNSFTLGRQDYQWRHEPVLYGWKDGAGHYFIDDRSQDTVLDVDKLDLSAKSKKELIGIIEAMRKSPPVQTTVIHEDKPLHNDLHPTMKPIRLLARLIANSSRRGDVVLDQFGGSGSTLIACEETGRRCRMMELDPAYVDVIVDRYQKFTGRKAIKQGGKK